VIAIELKRISRNRQHPTFGVMMHGGQPFAVTLERPWRDNERSKSCIPDGSYICERVDSPRFGDTFEVMSVTGRNHILFHKGNINADTHGCIIVGEMFDYLQEDRAVLSSAKGYKEFMALLNDTDKFSLVISDHYSGSLIQ
jgi:hypothetical protein